MKEKTTEEILQFYANARETYLSCGGHYKAYKNDQAVEKYVEELKARGIKVPRNSSEAKDKSFIINATIPEGKFNGIGSY